MACHTFTRYFYMIVYLCIHYIETPYLIEIMMMKA